MSGLAVRSSQGVAEFYIFKRFCGFVWIRSISSFLVESEAVCTIQDNRWLWPPLPDMPCSKRVRHVWKRQAIVRGEVNRLICAANLKGLIGRRKL